MARKHVALLAVLVVFSLQLTFFSPSDSSNAQFFEPNQVSYSLVNAYPKLSFIRPVDFQSPEDGLNSVYVVEQAGKIYVFENNNETDSKTLYLDIESKVDDTANEQGLLGLAFSPNFSEDGYFYVHYNIDSKSRISRFSHNFNTLLADLGSEYILLEVDQPYTNHNGGQISFGFDGMLYIGWGDGGSAGDPSGNGQNLGTLLGSVLRIDVNNQDSGLNYSIPADNPFIGVGGYREEIYAYGLRNPWRFSFDVETHDLWLADVGQNQWEEVDRIIPGGNYGWNTLEGTHCYSPSTNCNTTGLIMPVFEYNHTLGSSITGGYVYRGDQNPGLIGKYMFGDFGSGRIWLTDVTSEETVLIIESGTTISSFGRDASNEVFVLSFDGNIYGIVETGYIPPVTSTFVTTQTQTVVTVINDTTTTITSVSEFTTTSISSGPPPVVSSSLSQDKETQSSIKPVPVSVYFVLGVVCIPVLRHAKQQVKRKYKPEV